MDSPRAINGHSNSYSRYIEAPPIPMKYATQIEDEKEESKDHIIVDKIRSFSENTTAHGVRRIFIARNAYTARLWLLGILLCFGILVIQAHHLVKKFSRYGKITSIEVDFASSKHILHSQVVFQENCSEDATKMKNLASVLPAATVRHAPFSAGDCSLTMIRNYPSFERFPALNP
ncbi:unnamed protein product [Toxocara canis]|uniref:Integral membrane protein 2 n=1 Tax=Toxocara canis TaxID=6265 RepID=A0A183U1W1_TOXCA|nr:unnamed protein product [Toxocara canis]